MIGCILIIFSHSTENSCVDPKFGYDITSLEFLTPDGPTYFGVDTDTEVIRSESSLQYSRALGVMQPLSLGLNLAAVFITLRTSRPLFVLVATTAAWLVTTATVSFGMVWVVRLESYSWRITGGQSTETHASGSLGPAVYTLVIALALQFLAWILNFVYYHVHGCETSNKLPRRCGQEAEAIEMAVSRKELHGDWDGTSNRTVKSSEYR